MARVISIALLATDRMSQAFSDSADSAEKLEKRLGGLNKVAKAGGLAIAAGGAASLASAMAPAVAAVAAMPAAMAASKVASATLKVGMMGVADAMSAAAEGGKEADEALKKLAPSARAFVKEAVSLKKQWTGIQQVVQQNLFQGLAGQLDKLGKTLLPTVGDGMASVAGELNGIALEAAKTANTPWFRGQVDQVFSGTAGIMATLSGAVKPLVQSVLTLVNAGLPLVNRMAGWAVQGAKAAASFLLAKQQSGALGATITKIGDGLETAGRIARNFGLAIANVVGQANAFGVSGGNMVSTLEQASAAMLTWSQSSQGQGQAAAGFQMLGDAANNLAVVLPILAGSIGIIAKAIMALPPSVQGAAVQMTSWGIVASILVTRLAKIPGVTRLAVMAMGGLKAAAIATKTAMLGFALGLKSVEAAYASNATWATRLGAAMRAQVLLWRQQAAAAGVSTVRIIAHAAAQKVVAVGTRIWAAAQWLLNAALTANPIGLVIAAVVALGAAVVLVYKKSETFRAVVQAAWAGIKAATATTWAFLKPVFSAIASVVGKVLPIAMTFLRNTAKIVWVGIQIAIKVAWMAIRAHFMAIKAVITGVVAPVFRWLWNNVIKPVWSGISAAIKWAWTNHIRPVFNSLKAGVSLVASGFRVSVDAIKKHWDRIKDIAKKPVNFVLGVYNRGIVDVVNKISKFAGLDTRLSPIKMLARGGTLANPAAARPMVTNGPIAIAGEGKRQHPEYVIPTDPAYRKRAQALWAAAGQDLAGRGGGGGRNRLGGEGMFFERGGIIGSFMKGLSGFGFLDPAKAFKGALSRLVGKVPGGGVFRDAVAGVPGKLIGYLLDWFKAKVGFGGGGAGVGKALSFAKAQDGKPYVWGGVGPGGYDCSGLWSAIVNVIKGRNPYSRLFSTHSFGASGPEGFVRGMRAPVRVGITDAGVGHMAGTIRRTNIESSGSYGVRFGGGARGADDGLFTRQYGLKADTGALALAPGWNPPVFNGTGRPEYLETPRRDSGRPIEVVLQLDGRVVARQIVNPLRQDIGRNGGNVQNYLGKRS